MSISLEQAERMYDRLYSDEEEREEPDINPIEEAWTREEMYYHDDE